MKKYIYLLLLCAIQLFAEAQNTFNRAYHVYKESSGPFLAEINNDLYYTTTHYGAVFYGRTCLLKHSNAGTLSYSVQTSLPTPPLHGFRSLDNRLMMAGGGYSCDVSIPPQVNYLVKFDTGGSQVFSSTYTVALGDSPKACLQLNDSSFLSFTDSLLFRHTKTGQFLSKKSLGLSNIKAALLLPNNTVLLCAKQNSASLLVVIDTSGSTLSVKPCPVMLVKLALYGGQKVMGLGSDGKLYKFSPALGFTGNSMFAGIGANNFIVANDTVYGLGNAGVIPYYLVCDTAFNTVVGSGNNSAELSQTALCLTSSGNAAIVSSLEASNSMVNYNASYTCLNVVNRLSGNSFTSDLSIMSVSTDTSYMEFLGPYNNLAYLKARVKLRNIGTRSITSFKLNSYLDPHVACGAFYYQERFSQLLILPGDSITVLTGLIKKRVPILTPGVTAVAYCLYLSVPNDEADKTFTGNELCANVNFITALSSNTGPGIPKVYPNPASNMLHIENAGLLNGVSILNTLGQTVMGLSGPQTVIDVSALQPGVYYLEAQNEKGRKACKFIKE